MTTSPVQDHRFEPFTDLRHASAPGDIVVIGAGLAGLFAALKLSPLPVTVVSAAPLGEGASSAWAQGGIAASVGVGDTPAAHARDTIAAGGGLVDEAVAQTIAGEAPDRIADLLRYGVPFDRDLEGHFVLSREAAHSEKRVVRVTGDRAGHAIMHALIAAVRATPCIRILEGFAALDLIRRETAIAGVRLMRTRLDGGTAFELVPANAVILATGGICGLYAATTNPEYARGEGLAMAARAGATIADAEFVQFHPTALDVDTRPTPLATEALRGEGATLVNADGRRFMPAIHADAELAPRDIVARAVFQEKKQGRGAYLDCREAIGAEFKSRFPTVYAHCIRHGLDPQRDLLPVTPAAHYHMGGIATDLAGRTDVPGLWAIGEVASTGLHGANRLASNSLLEATVMAARAATDAAKATHDLELCAAELRASAAVGRVSAPQRETLFATLSETLMNNVGVVRDATDLKEALETLAAIRNTAREADDTALADAALAASFTTLAALKRTESRGAHFRSDHPTISLATGQRSLVHIDEVEEALAKATKPTPAPSVDHIQPNTGTQAPIIVRRPLDPAAAVHGVCA